MKNKYLKSLLVLLILFLSITLVGCKKDNDDDPGKNPPVGETVYPVGLNISGFKEIYAVGEQLDTSGLIATLQYADGKTKDVSTEVEVNSNKYNKDADGTYEIIISYSKENYTVKNFFLAVVGTGASSGGNQGDGDDKNFGPGTYELLAEVALQDYSQSMAVAANTQYCEGFFTIEGNGVKRANASAFAFELPKAESAWIEFEVTGTATVTLVVSSTGSSNTSAIAIYDSESSVVVNNENITAVEGTTQVTLTYTLPTGTYRILSQAGTTHSTRGVRVYSVKVVQ